MATKRWLGSAAATTDKWTATIGGTWSAGDTVTVTINGKSVVATLGATVTTTEVASLVEAMFNSTTTPATDESYTPADGGQSIGEFTEYTADAASSTTVTFIANTAGIPGTISVSKSSASGTFSIAHTVTATGPSCFDNAANWSGGVAPANSDVLVFDAGSTDCLYNLSTSLTGLTINVLDGYTGKIGLPEIHVVGNGITAYDEYRTKSLTTAGGTTTVTIDNAAIGRCRMAFGAQTVAIVVRNTGYRLDPAVPAVLFTGGNASSTLTMTKGDVGCAFYASETGQFTTVDVGYRLAQATDVQLWMGSGMTLATVRKDGGSLTLNGNVTTLTQNAKGGITTFLAGTPATANIDGGWLIYNSTSAPAGTAWRVTNDGYLDFDQDPRAKTAATTITLNGTLAKIRDRKAVVASLAVTFGFGATAAQVDRGTNYTATYS